MCTELNIKGWAGGRGGATYLRCGENLSMGFLEISFICFPTVKEFLRLVNIWQSYSKNESDTLFMIPGYLQDSDELGR